MGAHLQWVEREHALTGREGAWETPYWPICEQKSNAAAKLLGIASKLLFTLRMDCVNCLVWYYLQLIRNSAIAYIHASLGSPKAQLGDMDTVLG